MRREEERSFSCAGVIVCITIIPVSRNSLPPEVGEWIAESIPLPRAKLHLWELEELAARLHLMLHEYPFWYVNGGTAEEDEKVLGREEVLKMRAFLRADLPEDVMRQVRATLLVSSTARVFLHDAVMEEIEERAEPEEEAPPLLPLREAHRRGMSVMELAQKYRSWALVVRQELLLRRMRIQAVLDREAGRSPPTLDEEGEAIVCAYHRGRLNDDGQEWRVFLLSQRYRDWYAAWLKHHPDSGGGADTV